MRTSEDWTWTSLSPAVPDNEWAFLKLSGLPQIALEEEPMVGVILRHDPEWAAR